MREFDSHAQDYDSELMEGLRLSGESKEFYARGRLTLEGTLASHGEA
jgi:hypothetical protein